MKLILYGCVSAVIIGVYCSLVTAEVVTDGSLGGIASELSGPNYAITPDLGQQTGSNLFHSFSTFNLATGEQANFSAGNGIQNIIARVTGGEVSSINGTINSESTSLWMINPAGWVFGADAKINVNGAFHVSTADSVRFEDGSHFFADTAGQSVLTISQPVGMSFLKPQQARITLDNTILELPEKSTLSILAGDVSVNNATIRAPGGQVLIGAATTAGDWVVNEQGLQTDNTAELGRVAIVNENFLPDPAQQAIDISDPGGVNGGGKIQLVAGDTLLENAKLFAFTSGDQQGGDINLQSTGNLDLVMTVLQTDTLPGSKGDAGSLTIAANNLTMTEDSTVSASTQLFSEGSAGEIDIDINKALSLSGTNTQIISTVNGEGDGSRINIHTQTIDMSDNAVIRTTTAGVADSGEITISSQLINMNSGATIDTSSFVAVGENAGKTGQLTIQTERLSLTGFGTLIISTSFLNGGPVGDVHITASQINLSDQAEIRADSFSQADAGNIVITNRSQLNLDNARITTEAVAGDGGQITINSQDLMLKNVQLRTSAIGTQGDGGNINIESELLTINTSFIQANTSASGGRGGDINVSAKQFIASRGHVEVGGQQQLSFTADSGVNVIQAAAPDGVSGQVTVSNVELNITGQLKPIQSSFSSRQNISGNPCRVARGQTLSSLVVAGKGGLPVNASEDLMLPVSGSSTESDNPGVKPANHSHTNNKAMKQPVTCPKDMK